MEVVTMERRETSLLPEIELKETRNVEAKTVKGNNEEKQINKEQSFAKEIATEAKKEEEKTVNGNNDTKKSNEEDSFAKEEAKETMKEAAAAKGKEDAAAETKISSEFISGSSEEEQNKVRLMKALVQKQDPSSKDVDDFMMRRFLRARDMDIDKASSMLLKYLNWRQTFLPKGSISASDIPNDLAQNKMFLQGNDKKGRPVSVVFGGRHFHNKGGLEEFKRFVVFALEKLCARMPTGQEKFVVIGDLQGWGFANSDIRAYLGALTILQDYYPERLGKLFIVHVPYIFMAVWKVVYPFIDDNTKKKIVFVENKKLKTTLLEDIEESQIPDIYGGKLPLVPIHDS